MIEWLTKYWYLIILFFAVLAFTVFGVYKAAKASAKHNRLYREEEEKIKRLKYLREEFPSLSEDVIDGAPDGDLLEGIALFYQLRLQKEEDMVSAFSALSEPAQFVYTLDIFSSEGGSLTGFYRENGKPLTELLVPAFEAVGLGAYKKYALPICRMLDGEDETVSVDYAKMEQNETAFQEIYSAETLKSKAAAYIRAEKSAFKY